MKITPRFATLSAALLLAVPAAVQSQTTLYVSNLDQPSNPFLAEWIRSNAYTAQRFDTGNNPAGYAELKVHLGMLSNVGSPGGFSVALYDAARGVLDWPGNMVAPLTGPTPSLAGIYTYVAPTVTLPPSTIYFVVVTAESPSASGAFRWNRAATESYNASNGWAMSLEQYYSSDGGNWGAVRGGPLVWGVSGTAIPEPSVVAVLLMGASVLLSVRWSKPKSRQP